ncbi:MAG: hypothetical protein U9Q15_01445 [Patescibacteria group bacterium]|nr:hypothetical protein [Patescibacteria group bacterium]
MKKLLFGIVSTILIYNGFALYYEGQQYTVPDSMYDIRIEK